ncbi:MAG TPA: hypothetical protein VFS08_17325 [Gemmatimonadaceae bacterium]|nr:hypothetical protein [Gemmatimonadaceae bacterium]
MSVPPDPPRPPTGPSGDADDGRESLGGARDRRHARRAGAHADRRAGGHRRHSRAGTGRRQTDHPTDGSDPAERRRTPTLHEQRARWAEVRRWMRQHDLDPFRDLLERLARAAFGPAATVMPHLRRSRGQRYLIFVVDAACPEAATNYAGFLPLERAFWTAYATIPKPVAAFVVAVRPARGWCRSEALMPLFTQFAVPEQIT